MKKIISILLAVIGCMLITSCASKHAHSYTALITNPTCSEQGYTLYKCECGKTYKENFVDTLDHQFGEWVVYTKPQETKEGLQKRTCSQCHYVEEQVIKATGNVINTVEDLIQFAEDVTNGKSYFGETVYLMADLNLKDVNFKGIGANTMELHPGKCFQGVFEGNGHTISNMTIEKTQQTSFATAGFFNQVSANAVIKNLNFVYANVESNHYAGVVCGYSAWYKNEGVQIINCTVENSTVTTNVNGAKGNYDDADKAAGIIGYLYNGLIDNCLVRKTTINGYRDLGGIVGYAENIKLNNSNVEQLTINVDIEKNYKKYETLEEFDANALIGEAKNCKVENSNGDVNVNMNKYINNVEQLLAFSEDVTNGNDYKGIQVVLTADLDLSGTTFNGIGAADIATYPRNTFNGTFNGQNHTISNMTIESVTQEAFAASGFFNTLGYNAIVKNVNFDKATVNSNHYAGVVAGYCDSYSRIALIQNCNVTNSSVTTNVTGTADNYDNGDKAGAIVGYFVGRGIVLCSVKDTTVKGYRDLGGIVGYAVDTYISECKVSNVTITVDKTKNYKEYTKQEEFDANSFVGESHNSTIVLCEGEAKIN